MIEAAPATLGPWASFYVMTGSSAAALTGLMFVVIGMITGSIRKDTTGDGIATFSTPTVVYFATVLLLCAVMVAPWRLLVHPAVMLALVGVAGVGYTLRLMRRTKRLTTYEPDIEDWAWYSILPLTAYAAILIGAAALFVAPVTAMFVVALGAVLLIFIGIHNAWDIVTFLAIDRRADSPNG